MKHFKYHIILITISFLMALSGCYNNNEIKNDFSSLESSLKVTSEEVTKNFSNINSNIDTGNTALSSNVENSTKDVLRTENTTFNPDDTSDTKEIKIKIVIDDILLGGFENGNWIDSETIISDISWDNVPSCDFFVYSENGEDRTGELYEAFGEDMEIILKGPDHNTAIVQNSKLIGFTKPDNTDDSISYKTVNEFFSNEGLSEKYKINITQSVSTDLDNDGIDENIISVRNYNESDLFNQDYFACNNYSYLLLSKNFKNNKILSIVDEASIYEVPEDLKESYYGEIKDTNLVSLSQFSIIGIIDINKDGVMEVIVCNEIWEGIFYRLYEYKDGKLIIVLEAGIAE